MGGTRVPENMHEWNAECLDIVVTGSLQRLETGSAVRQRATKRWSVLATSQGKCCRLHSVQTRGVSDPFKSWCAATHQQRNSVLPHNPTPRSRPLQLRNPASSLIPLLSVCTVLSALAPTQFLSPAAVYRLNYWNVDV